MKTRRWRVFQAILAFLSIFVVARNCEGATSTPPFSCWINDVPNSVGPYRSIYIPGEGLLVAEQDYISFFHGLKNEPYWEIITNSLSSQNYPGPVYNMISISPHQVLLYAANGFFLVQINHGDAVVTALKRDQQSYLETYTELFELPGAGVLIEDGESWLFAHQTNQGIKISPLTTEINFVYTNVYVPGFGALILGDPIFAPDNKSHNHRGQDRSVIFRSKSDRLTALPNVLANVEEMGGNFVLKPLAEKITGGVYVGFNLAGLGAFIGAQNGDFLATSEHGKLAFVPIINGDVGPINTAYDLSASTILVGASTGLFEAVRNKTTLVMSRVAGSQTGFVSAFHSAPGGGVLAEAHNGLFLVTNVDGHEEARQVGGDETGEVRALTDIPEVGLLIGAAKGLFLLHSVRGELRADKIETGKTDLTFISQIFPITGGNELPTIAILTATPNGLWLGDMTSLSGAIVGLPDRSNFDDYVLSSPQTMKLDFTVDHECTDVADSMGFQISVTAPDGRRSIVTPDSVDESESEPVAYLTASVLVNKPGGWSFQVFSKTDDGALVGKAQYLKFKAPEPPYVISLTSLIALWPWILACFSIFAVLASFTLFFAARYSPRAWRLVTDDIVGAWVFPIAAWLISHFSWAQLWILDQYFQRRRAQLDAPAPFLALPLTDKQGAVADYNVIAGPP